MVLEGSDFIYKRRPLGFGSIRYKPERTTRWVDHRSSRHFDEVSSEIFRSPFTNDQRMVLVQLSLDHFGWAMHAPATPCHAAFLKCPALTWTASYGQFARHFVWQINFQAAARSNNQKEFLPLFLNHRYLYEANPSTGEHRITDEADGHQHTPTRRELEHLDATLAAVNELPGLSTRQIPLIGCKAHGWFAAASCNPGSKSYEHFFACAPAAVSLMLLAEAIDFDKTLGRPR